MRRSTRNAKTKPHCYSTKKPNILNEETEIKNRLQRIAIVIENVIYHDGDIEYSEALNYLNLVKTIKEKLPNQSVLLTFCDLLINQLNKIIEIINVSSKIETDNSENMNTKHKNKNIVIENDVNSSQETYCAVLENCDTDPADTNELGSDINIVQNNGISKKIVDVEDFIPYTIVPQMTGLKDKKIVDKPIDLSSHKLYKSTNNDILIKKHQISQPIDYSSKINTNINHDKSIPTESTSKINKEATVEKNMQTKIEINSCPTLRSRTKSNETTNQSYSEQSVFRKPLNYKPKSKKRKHVLPKTQIVQVSNETIKTDTKKVSDKINIDKTIINKIVQRKSSNRSILNNNAIQKAKSTYNIIKNPKQHQFTIHFNSTPQTSQNILDTEETYNSEDCFDDIFTDNRATDTDESLMMLDLKCKLLNINENSENTAIISEIEESTDWTIESPIVQIQHESQQINEPSSNNEESLQNKIQEIKSQENFKYDENESVVTNIRNYRKTFVRKILQLRDVMQGTPVKHQLKKNFNSLFKTTTKDDSSTEIIKSQYVCPPSPKTDKYKDVEAFVNRENESDEEFIKRLKDKSRELSGISVQQLLQKMENYNRL